MSEIYMEFEDEYEESHLHSLRPAGMTLEAHRTNTIRQLILIYTVSRR